ncbi:Rhodanese-like domain containing protein [Trichomonas vaginalis G3]|uniref:Rhodanese-like domain containing protein n=1 Tax=Trichomonas vaginalis (strain ATCC PRA-98 / G3) TaxID=412133 RepID=A2DI79_TRIV3|nr:thiosulfate sulfurtransferase protein [Trichomonas vaginalis G3]EAY19875.1 Rhodanese-like domain containing protein [Trichomonas vaginalis G3]KAI5509997.1 thiosulfate sulfurtransferase protein [Trichomonas vaginalis G3]|eukprot:XP_001580861.1 Rhodanese-like domain containing protein [Trichomonas vaginalis G3]
MFETIVTPEQLAELQEKGSPLQIWDCSYDLVKKDWGLEEFIKEHVPGAIFIDIHHDLCAEEGKPRASGGRHPLPTREDFQIRLGSFGITPETQIIVYDRNGSNFCVRAWWMLRWAGHKNVAVLDGGLRAWKESRKPTAAGERVRPHVEGAPAYNPGPELVRLWTIDQVKENLITKKAQLFDARAPERYRGDVEPLDPRAGHIPGAINRPCGKSFTPEGKFLPADDLREQLKGFFPEGKECVSYCGSGITATPLVLAAKIANMPEPIVFGGSFSEWSRDDSVKVETGPNPYQE